MKLWYQNPAKCWSEALPVGNGRMGGMVFGRTEYEMIQLNEDSVWSGKKLDRINPDALENLPKIRALIREGKIGEAQELAMYALSGVPNSQRCYQNAGECYIHMHHTGACREYRRELDLETGIACVQYETAGVTYQREILASHPDGCMVIRLTTKEKVPFSFDCHLGRSHNFTDEVWKEGSDMVCFQVDGGKDGISFCAAVGVVTEAGVDAKYKTVGEHLVIENTQSALLFLDIETSFRHEDYRAAAVECCLGAMKKSWEELKAAHVKDYRSLFSRLELHYDRTDEKREQIPTDIRLAKVQSGKEDMGLMELYFQYARYLLIASSREGSLPANLQGIWCDSLTPIWDSKYTININTEMNYWMAETGNLSECHMPYFEFLGRVCESGKETARRMYGCRGSVAHHNTDIYADTAPQDHCMTSTFWVMGEAWLATHIWEHYQFTQDRRFLEKYFPVLEECVQFFYDFLTERPDGTLVTSPSISPENTYRMEDGTLGVLCESATMDVEILNELFLGYISACTELGKEDERPERARAVMERFPSLKTGKYGQLQEWMEDYDEPEPGHRHISHLYGVYPGTTITKEDTPELMQAALKSLERRLENGGGHTGWSRAWIIALWAAFRDGKKAYENLQAILTMGTYPNLMDNHPVNDGYVFQIDGNFGAAAAMLEMLVKSRPGSVELLPAVTAETGSGSLRGIRIRGGAQLSMRWENGRVCWISIDPDRIADKSYLVQLHVNGRTEEVKLVRGTVFEKTYQQ